MSDLTGIIGNTLECELQIKSRQLGKKDAGIIMYVIIIRIRRSGLLGNHKRVWLQGQEKYCMQQGSESFRAERKFQSFF